LEDFRTITSGDRLEQLVSQQAVDLPSSAFSADGWSLAGAENQAFVQRLKQMNSRLYDYLHGKAFFGIKSGLNRAFVIDESTRERLIAQDSRSAGVIKPALVGRDVDRYSINYQDRYLIWTYKGIPIREYPAILAHLSQFQAELETRWDKGDYWWELRACDYYDKFTHPKIIYPDIATTCRFTLDREGYFSTNTTYFIPGDDPYLLGLLNSRLAHFYFSQVCAGLEGSGTTYLRFFGQYLEGFPVRTIDFSQPAEAAQHARMVALVETMLTLQRQLAAARMPQDRTPLGRQIEATDRQIDALVYALYGLTDDEIKIVEGSQKP
jgi:hypothetical protein